ncbi:esterase/lipase family protein [Nocardia sp. NPDC059764]|uniref:esterase/lipase family protein n=1 Tax=Nocardia sp. NPDC059764 TaxID=3346939 RepID=UPI00364978A6
MMTRVRGTSGSLLILAVLAMLGITASGAARAEYPVSFNFFAGIPYELADPGGSLPGSNDWNCKPSAAHPDPVVLVHGTAGGAQTNWGAYAPLLANEGYCVFALTYGALDVPWPLSAMGGFRTIEDSSAQLAAFVARVRVATGAPKVDLIAHSQGNIVGQYFVKRLGGSGQVDKFVAIAAPWLGTYGGNMAMVRAFAARLGADTATVDAAIGMGVCPACSEMLGGDPFMTALNADGVYDPTVAYTNLDTRYDELIVPYTIGLVPGPNVTNFFMQDGCPIDYSDHLAIAGSHRGAMIALNALDPEHPRPVPCEFVPPLTG